MSEVLIYFKQKPVLHHGLALLAVFAILISFDVWLGKGAPIPARLRTFALLTTLTVGCLMSQFLYQVRPYTYYISGIAMAGIVLTAMASRLAAGQRSSISFAFIPLFFLAYFIGTFLSADLVQAIVFALSIMLAIIFLLEKTGYVRFLPAAGMVVLLLVFWKLSAPIVYFDEQASFEDKVVFSATTQHHDLVITQWQDDQWFFLDGLKNLSSIDEYLYYEPMVHGVMKLVPECRDVLVLGGENGCLIREVLKWEEVAAIDVVSYDTIFRNLGQESPIFTQMNEGAFDHEAVRIVRNDLIRFLVECEKNYQAVFIDLPDPRDVETNQYYTHEFYLLIKALIAEGGAMITQAGSPYFATQAYYSIGETIRSTGFSVLPLHNQILTLGEWGWYICSADLEKGEISNKLRLPMEHPIATRWFNDEAASLISSFGKTYFDTMDAGINTLDSPLVYQYYLKGNWKLN